MFEFLKTVHKNKHLIVALTKKEVTSRYQGSIIGFMWSFFNPILMLLVYTFVFSVVFNAKWGGGEQDKSEFAIILFAGLMVFNFFAECITKAPGLIIGNVNYVKKVIFPLEILPLISMASALVNLIISFSVWLVFFIVIKGSVPLTIIFFPVILAPMCLMTMGVTWFLSAFTVYVRDTTQIVNMFVSVLMFLSPIFFPIDALPEKYRLIMRANPLGEIIEQTRNVLIWDRGVSWNWVMSSMLLGILCSLAGYYLFKRMKDGFADVL